MKWQVSLVCFLLLSLTACGTSKPKLDKLLQKFEEQEVAWTACDPSILPTVLEGSLTALGERLECATLLTPLDWEDPERDEINLGVLRVKAADESKRKGAILLNPGGPGGDGLIIAALFAVIFDSNGGQDLGFPAAAPELLGQVSEQYDIVGFSPRGVGGSFQLFCGSNKVLPDSNFYTDRSPENIEALLSEGRLITEACQNNPLHQFINTEQTVQDMNLIRKLLGDEKLNYLGFSYGSWLGSWYAKRFPEHTGNMVLDANTEFSASFQDVASLQPMGFQRAFEDVALAYAARNNAVFGLGATKEEVYSVYEGLSSEIKELLLFGSLGLLNQLYVSDAVPDIAISLLAARGVDAVLKVFESPLTPEAYNAFLASVAAFAFVANGDLNAQVANAAGLLALDYINAQQALPQQVVLEPGSSVLVSVVCNDSVWNQDPNYYSQFGNEQNKNYPLLGGLATSEPCAFWGEPSAKMPELPKDFPKILMVQTGYDAATPVEGALRAFESLPNAHLVYVENEMTHAAFPYNTDCVDAKVANFLLDGTLPKESTSNCEAKPLPGEAQVYPPGSVPSVQGAGFSLQAALEPPVLNPLYRLVHETIKDNSVDFFNRY